MNGGQTTPSMAEVIRAALAAHTKTMRVALPGRVESYDPTTCSCSVQPLVNDGVADETGVRRPERLPVIVRVPVVFPGAGGMRITFPIQKGDTVLLVFASSSIDRWLALGGEVDPIDDHRHHVTDAIAIPGLTDFPRQTAAHATAAVIEGTDVRLGAQGAADAAVKGTAYRSAEDTMLTAIQTLATALATSAPPLGAVPQQAATATAATAAATAITTFQASASTYLSTRVKVG